MIERYAYEKAKEVASKLKLKVWKLVIDEYDNHEIKTKKFCLYRLFHKIVHARIFYSTKTI
jgi:hypothetical protein